MAARSPPLPVGLAVLVKVRFDPQAPDSLSEQMGSKPSVTHEH